MSGSQEIRSQIASIQNTQKITKAMEMVAASKMKKAQDQMIKYILLPVIWIIFNYVLIM